MSKSNGTTKIATFVAWVFEGKEYDDEFVEAWTDELSLENAGDCVGAITGSGLRVAGVNTFTGAMPGDKVVLRANAPRSYDTKSPRKWVMTGIA